MTTLDLFQEASVEIEKPEPMTEVRLGRRSARVPLRKQRRAALARLMDILADLEGKDIYIGSYDAGGRHFWLDNLNIKSTVAVPASLLGKTLENRPVAGLKELKDIH